MSNPTIWYEDICAENEVLLPPRTNANGNAMSARVRRAPSIQFGDAEEEMFLYKEKRGKAIYLKIIHEKFHTWMEAFDQRSAWQLHENSEAWFGKVLSLDDCVRMHASIITRKGCVTFIVSPTVRVLKMSEEEEEMERVELADVPYDSVVTPIVTYDGLYIGPNFCCPQFTLQELIVHGPRREEQAPSKPPTFRKRTDVDLFNPRDTWSDEDSNGSWRTQAHNEYVESQIHRDDNIV